MLSTNLPTSGLLAGKVAHFDASGRIAVAKGPTWYCFDPDWRVPLFVLVGGGKKAEAGAVLWVFNGSRKWFVNSRTRYMGVYQTYRLR